MSLSKALWLINLPTQATFAVDKQFVNKKISKHNAESKYILW